jgi:hypothetical protein
VLFFVHVNGDATAVIDNGDRIVSIYSNLDVACETGKRFVDRVINHLIDEVMQAFGRDVANIHSRAFTHGFKALKHLNVTGAILFFCF